MPMTPWVSVNSNTMLVIRSHFDSSPARVAWLTSAPIWPAIQPAMAWIRSVLARRVPSCCWNSTVSRRGRLSSRRFLRSVLKKNSASARRGRTTFSLPEIICCGSLDSILATKIKFGSSLPAASYTGKYFWSPFMVYTSASAGTARNFSSNLAVNTTGHSTSEATSSSRLSLRSALPPMVEAASSASRLIIALRVS
ncbi:hypothetical protein D3C80_1205590 [compost metagenome]